MVTVPEIHIEPRIVRQAVETHPSMKRFKNAVKERFRVSDEEAGGFAERLLGDSVKRFGGRYLGEMAEHIERIFELRDRAANVIEEVIGEEALSAEDAGTKLDGAFKEIKTHMDAITDPVNYAKRKPPNVSDIDFGEIVTKEDAKAAADFKQGKLKALPSGRHAEQPKMLARKLKRFSQSRKNAVRAAADFAPRELWRAVASESQQGLEENISALRKRAADKGMAPREIDNLESAARELALERSKLRPPGEAEDFLRAEGLQNLAATIERALDEEPEFLKDSSLRKLSAKERRERIAQLGKLVKGNRQLELLAAQNPRHLMELFEASGASAKTQFTNYIRGRMISHIKGLAGEFTAAFHLGDQGIVLLKAPDYNVTIPGTDLVGVTRNGKIWLIDNKALSAAELESVTSLTRNVAQNVADDASSAVADLGRGKDPYVGDAVKRLDEARKEIKKLTNGKSNSEIGTLDMQQQIDAICSKYNIERVVTNAGGKVEGLSNALQEAGIVFSDVSAPINKNPLKP
jgi:hypothetical protein